MKYGLFIGINQYTNGVTPLNCARNDALALSKLFALNGYEVDALLDQEASATNIRKKLRAIGKKLKKDDFFFFYFSGHGCEVNKNHYLIGQAAYPDGIEEGEETVALSRVRELTDIPGVRRLFVLDCCRNDLHSGKSLEVCPESRDIALAKISNFQYEAAEIIHPLIVTSCSTGERAYEDVEKGRGYFTQILEKSLSDKTISSFSAFRKALAEGMENIQKIMKRKQTLCWHGNVDSWDEFDLLDSWSEVKDYAAQESKFLSPENRMKYNDLIFSLDETCRKVMVMSASESVKEKLTAILETIRILADEERNNDNFRKLQNLHSEIENIKKNLKFYQSVFDSVREIEKVRAFLKEHAIALDPAFLNLEKRAVFAQEKDDFEVANNFWNEAKILIGKQKMLLISQLKQIEDLKSEIKKIENQLACDSAFIPENFDYFDQLRNAESLKAYAKVESVLTAIWMNNQNRLEQQNKALDSISNLKSEVQTVEEFFRNEKFDFPENYAELRDSAQKLYDQKKYFKSEKQWESLLQLLNNKKEDYQSYLSVKNKVESLEKEFAEKKISVSGKIREICEKAKNAELYRNFSEAELLWERVVSLLQEDDSAVRRIKKVREQITQKRQMLEASGEKIPEAYRVYLQNADKAKAQNEYKEELQCLRDARALLNNLENQIDVKQQAEIDAEIRALAEDFKKKNNVWYGKIVTDEVLEEYKLGYNLNISKLGKNEQVYLWKKNLRVLEFEKTTLLLHLILTVSFTIISSLILSRSNVFGTYVLGTIAFIPIILTFCGIRPARMLFSCLFHGIITGIVMFCTSDSSSAFVGIVMIVIQLVFIFVVALGSPIIFFFAPLLFKAIWRKKYKDLIDRMD